MRVLSLFDGISVGKQSLNDLNVPCYYYSSEIDKYALQISNKNHPDNIRLGDVTDWRDWNVIWASIDLLIAGSPCQGFSFAGKQLAFDDPRSKLFFEFVDILNHIRKVNPNIKFMLENVKMKKEHLSVITEQLCVEPILINSALVSAQNRNRYYWTNWHVEQPEDKGIVLADIIESGFVDKDKAHCIYANYFKGGNLKSYFEKNRRQLVFKKPRTEGEIPSLAASGGNKKYRKLTPVECERLQTLPDNYTEGVSDTQRYKTLGNAWTLEVVKHIFRQGLL